MSKTVYRCDHCKSDDILQQAHIMVSPNLPLGPIDLNQNGEWDDFYWCNKCEEECGVEESVESDVYIIPTIEGDK